MVSGLKFRAALYEPICGLAPAQGAASGRARPPPALGRRLLGLAAVFSASGLTHELAHWYLTRRLSGGAELSLGGTVHIDYCSIWPLPCAFNPAVSPPPAGWWMAFFCLQAPLLLAEAWLQRLGRQAHIQLPRPVRTAITLLVLHCRECPWEPVCLTRCNSQPLWRPAAVAATCTAWGPCMHCSRPPS